MFSHPKLPKCCQARISPKCLKPEMRKHWQGSNFPKIPKIRRGYSCSDFANFRRNSIFADVFAFSASGMLGKFNPCRCFRIRGCPPPMIHCLQKAGSGGSWGGREHIHEYICIHTQYPNTIMLTPDSRYTIASAFEPRRNTLAVAMCY